MASWTKFLVQICWWSLCKYLNWSVLILAPNEFLQETFTLVEANKAWFQHTYQHKVSICNSSVSASLSLCPMQGALYRERAIRYSREDKVSKSWEPDTCSSILMSYFCLMTKGEAGCFEVDLWILMKQRLCAHLHRVHAGQIRSNTKTSQTNCFMGVKERQRLLCSVLQHLRKAVTEQLDDCFCSPGQTAAEQIVFSVNIPVSVVTPSTFIGDFFIVTSCLLLGTMQWSIKTGVLCYVQSRKLS